MSDFLIDVQNIKKLATTEQTDQLDLDLYALPLFQDGDIKKIVGAALVFSGNNFTSPEFTASLGNIFLEKPNSYLLECVGVELHRFSQYHYQGSLGVFVRFWSDSFKNPEWVQKQGQYCIEPPTSLVRMSVGNEFLKLSEQIKELL